MIVTYNPTADIYCEIEIFDIEYTPAVPAVLSSLIENCEPDYPAEIDYTIGDTIQYFDIDQLTHEEVPDFIDIDLLDDLVTEEYLLLKRVEL